MANMLRAATSIGCGAARRVCQLHQDRTCAVIVTMHATRAQPVSLRPHELSSVSKLILGSFRPYGSRVVVACASDATTIELEVKVEGMKCGGCSSRVEAALKAMDHVKDVQVDLESKLATVEVEAPNLIDAMNMLPNFVNTIKELGFEAEPHIEYQL